METVTLICRANQWSGFYMIGTSVMKEIIKKQIKSITQENRYLQMASQCLKRYDKTYLRSF